MLYTFRIFMRRPMWWIHRNYGDLDTQCIINITLYLEVSKLPKWNIIRMVFCLDEVASHLYENFKTIEFYANLKWFNVKEKHVYSPESESIIWFYAISQLKQSGVDNRLRSRCYFWCNGCDVELNSHEMFNKFFFLFLSRLTLNDLIP